MARLLGARKVIATVSNAEKAALARQAGADVTLDYRTEDLATRSAQLTQNEGVDRVIDMDLAANIGSAMAALKPGGDIVVYGSGRSEIAVPFLPAILKHARLRFFIVYNLSAADRAAAIEQLTRWLEQGRLLHNIAARLPLDRIIEAHELVESGKAVGNVVVEVA
jgi:NADPH2:quinone reductase